MISCCIRVLRYCYEVRYCFEPALLILFLTVRMFLAVSNEKRRMTDGVLAGLYVPTGIDLDLTIIIIFFYHAITV